MKEAVFVMAKVPLVCRQWLEHLGTGRHELSILHVTHDCGVVRVLPWRIRNNTVWFTYWPEEVRIEGAVSFGQSCRAFAYLSDLVEADGVYNAAA